MPGDGEVMTSGCKKHNPGRRNGPHRIGQCGRCSRKSANAADGGLAAVGFRNSVRAEIHADLQGDRAWVGFGAAATPAPTGDIRSRSRSRSNGCRPRRTDVAVIDVLMPTMSGIECAHLLQERYPKARVILISGSIFEDKRPHPDERGTDAYLEKSDVPERLHATILALAAETTAAPPSRTNA